jgi:peptidoglycan/xylan/chitin deacetylase (PgdA/CDA1 family)
MRPSLQVLAGMWSILPLPLRPSVMVLGYHRIDDVDDELAVRPGNFARQMAWLCSEAASVPVLPLEEALSVSASGPVPRRTVAVTIDDAWADVYIHGMPALLATSTPATLYVPSALLGSPRYMTREQVVDMCRAGIDIGGHSRTHADLRRCSDADLEREVRGCREDLEDLLGRRVTSFAYPTGLTDARVRRAVMAAGFETAVTTRRGWARSVGDPLSIPRNFVEEFPLPVFAAATRGGLNVLGAIDAARRPMLRGTYRRHQPGSAHAR